VKRAFVQALAGSLALSCFASRGLAAPESSEAVEASDKEEAASQSEAADEDFGHRGQFGVRAALVAGYRMVLRYDDSPWCRAYEPTKSASDQAKFCGHAAPLALDLGLSFAPLDFIEPYAWVRLGLAGESETDTEPMLIVGAGARIYTMSDSAFKIYVEPAIGLELEAGAGSPIYAGKAYKQDLVLHLAAGPAFDLAKNFGLFVDGGVTMGVLRAIHSSLELKAGVQGRFP
jgi:hypothetical protein